MLKRVPIVVILGSTGTGKTKLSLELAKKYDGEIISADSMQVYTGLNIATAKATISEQEIAPHHLINVAQPGVLYSVVAFRNSAQPIINNLLARNKMPIIVGGTNYYIESLLWKVLINSPVTSSTKSQKQDMNKIFNSDKTESEDQCLQNIITSLTKEQMETMESKILHQYLQYIDPITANRLHPNNKRRIIRAIEIFNTNGQPMSSILEKQRTEEGGSKFGGPLRYKNIILFWLQCDEKTLNERLDARVDSMVENGLLDEIRSFHQNYVKPFNDIDYTKGILQTIGFKEFIPYLVKFGIDEDKKILQFIMSRHTKQEQEIPKGLEFLNKCLNELKMVTRRYAKTQTKWIKNRFLENLSRDVPHLYKLDSTDVSKWQNDVTNRAEEVIEAFMECRQPNFEPEKRSHGSKSIHNEETTNFCETCDRVFIGEYQWNIHLNSNRHKKMLHKKKNK